MAPFVGGDGGGGGVGGGVLVPELPPSTPAEGGKGRPGLQRCGLRFRHCPRTWPDEPQTEPRPGL